MALSDKIIPFIIDKRSKFDIQLYFMSQYPTLPAEEFQKSYGIAEQKIKRAELEQWKLDHPAKPPRPEPKYKLTTKTSRFVGVRVPLRLYELIKEHKTNYIIQALYEMFNIHPENQQDNTTATITDVKQVSVSESTHISNRGRYLENCGAERRVKE